MNAGTPLTAFAREKKWMIKGVLGCSFCDFYDSFICITETREYWKFLVDEKLSDWNSEFNFAYAMNFVISLRARVYGYEGVCSVIWMCPSSNLRSYNNLATTRKLVVFILLWKILEGLEKYWRILSYREQNARIFYFSSGKTEMYLISMLLHLVNFIEM